MNIKVVLLSLLGIGFIVISFVVDWIFIIGAVIIMFINQRELNKGSKNSNGGGSEGDSDGD